MDYTGRVVTPLITIVETPEFIADASRLMTDENREELIAHLAANPSAGDLIPGTGGVRKLRWKLEGRGKRGGARVIHFFHSTEIPLFLLAAFAKSEKTDLSQQERNELRNLTKALVASYRRRKR